MKKTIKTLLEAEMNDNIAIVNKSDIDKRDEFGKTNWSAEYQINKKKGKQPFKLEHFQFVPVEKGHELKDAIYLRPEEAQELNTVGKGIYDLLTIFTEKRKQFNAFTPSEQAKNYDRFRRDDEQA